MDTSGWRTGGHLGGGTRFTASRVFSVSTWAVTAAISSPPPPSSSSRLSREQYSTSGTVLDRPAVLNHDPAFPTFPPISLMFLCVCVFPDICGADLPALSSDLTLSRCGALYCCTMSPRQSDPGSSKDSNYGTIHTTDAYTLTTSLQKHKIPQIPGRSGSGMFPLGRLGK